MAPGLGEGSIAVATVASWVRDLSQHPCPPLTWDASRVRTTHGWPYPFRERPWAEIAAFLAGMAETAPEFAHMRDIAQSVISANAESLLAACTSMHDIIVVPRPIPEPPYDVIVVRAPGSIRSPTTGHVLVEHLSCTGHNDRIERATSEAVPLFWRFVLEKYGVEANGSG